MTANQDSDIPEELEQFREAWETYDNTGDDGLLEEVLAENVVHVSPDSDPIAGREALLEALPDVTDREWEMERDSLVISDDLAVEQFTIRWTRTTDDGDTEEGTIDSVDVYQRTDDGSWKQIVSLPRRPE